MTINFNKKQNMGFLFSKYHFKSDKIFDNLSIEHMNELNAIRVIRSYSKGDILYEEGSKPLAVYCLKKGKVKIEQLNQDGKNRIVYIYSEGEYFGFRPLLCNENHPVSASFIEDSEIEMYEGVGFLKISKKSSDLAFNLIEILSFEFNVWVNIISALSHKSAKEKIALIFLILNEKYKNTEGISEITMTKADIANYSETSEETVVRVISFFENQGVLKNQGRMFEIIDTKLLEIIAEGF